MQCSHSFSKNKIHMYVGSKSGMGHRLRDETVVEAPPKGTARRRKDSATKDHQPPV